MNTTERSFRTVPRGAVADPSLPLGARWPNGGCWGTADIESLATTGASSAKLALNGVIVLFVQNLAVSLKAFIDKAFRQAHTR